MAGAEEIRIIIAGLTDAKKEAEAKFKEASAALADALAALKPAKTTKAPKAPGAPRREKAKRDPLVAVPYRAGWRCPGSIVTHATKEAAEEAARAQASA